MSYDKSYNMTSNRVQPRHRVCFIIQISHGLSAITRHENGFASAHHFKVTQLFSYKIYAFDVDNHTFR